MEEGIVYILTNPAMPGLVKIGMTTRLEVSTRMAELFTTGVPVPFQCSFAGRVLDARNVERAFHQAFDPQRINHQREFFEIEDIQAIGLLKLLCVEDVTPEIVLELEKVDGDSKEAGKRMAQKRRPRFNFEEMEIPIGSILYSSSNEETCTVADERNVRFRDEIMSFTKATRLMLNYDYNVAPGFYWRFEGRKLRDIYEEVYSE